jgi:enoyl-CoA hydratase/carnithine racemase
MADDVLRLERRERIAILTLNRPERLNALNVELREALTHVCQKRRDDDSVWAVVLTGAGRGFCPDRLVPADTLLEEAIALARSIASWPPVAMQAARRTLQQSMESTLEEQLRHESFGLLMARRAPHDVQEARDSFRERRPPFFTGQ